MHFTKLAASAALLFYAGTYYLHFAGWFPCKECGAAQILLQSFEGALSSIWQRQDACRPGSESVFVLIQKRLQLSTVGSWLRISCKAADNFSSSPFFTLSMAMVKLDAGNSMGSSSMFFPFFVQGIIGMRIFQF
jgi:hypothetical protein